MYIYTYWGFEGESNWDTSGEPEPCMLFWAQETASGPFWNLRGVKLPEEVDNWSPRFWFASPCDRFFEDPSASVLSMLHAAS